jgi:NAD(P)-dependent dehydrogenase (short-subunit alcohol dehydrogenase family)
MSGRLDNQVVLVTGGLSGIGAATCEMLAAEGALVIAADVSASPRTLSGETIAPLWLDVTEPDSVTAAVDSVVARHGRLDGLVHCAGIGLERPFLETSVGDFDRILAVNLRGAFLVGQAAAQVMAAQGRGAIVNIGSVSGMTGNVGRSAYGASKGGMVTLSQVMAVELAALGVRVNVIAPGPIETPLVKDMHSPATREAWRMRTPVQRYGTPSEVGAAAVFLLSSEASYVTGHVLVVDGGFLAQGIAPRP